MLSQHHLPDARGTREKVGEVGRVGIVREKDWTSTRARPKVQLTASVSLKDLTRNQIKNDSNLKI